MDVLAGFVIHQSDLAKAEGGEKETGEIDLAEWDNLFASSNMDFHSLSRTVKALGKAESAFLLSRAKTFAAGAGGKGTYGAV